MKNINPKIHALVIVAHPDDESFLFAGTTLKFAEEGKSVGVICATKGEKGVDRLGRHLSEEKMAEIRTHELENACSTIHCNCLNIMDYHDGGLAQTNFYQLVDDLAEKIEKYEPKIVLTFGIEGISGHKDHITIGLAARAAVKKSVHKIKEIWLSSLPVSVMGQFNQYLAQIKVHHSHFQHEKLIGVPDEKLLKIDISKYSEAKLAALQAHQSQYLPNVSFELFLHHEYFEVHK